jgi:hypothetical protein
MKFSLILTKGQIVSFLGSDEDKCVIISLMTPRQQRHQFSMDSMETYVGLIVH